MLNYKQKKFFNENGYLIVRSIPEVKKSVNEIKKELLEFAKIYNKDIKNLNCKKIFELLKPDSKSRKSFYNTLRYFFSITKLSCLKKLKDLSISVGLKHPVVMRSYNLRMDMPSDRKHLFHWHQDITYLLGSKNSITFWIPLTQVNDKHGSIEIIPRSHKNGIYKFNYVGKEKISKQKYMSPKDIKLKKSPKLKSKLLKAKPGDVVIFSQLLLHRSSKNYSNKIRWVAQVRHSDLCEKNFKDAGYPFGDNTNIFYNHYIK